MRFLLRTFLWILFFTISLSAFAQPAGVDLPSLKSPYHTIYTHLYYLQEDSYQPAIAASTMYGIKDSLKAIQAAKRLKQIFDGKGLYVRLNALPQEPDHVDTASLEHFYTPFPNQLPEVYLERVDRKWYYSQETVQLIPDLHNEIYPLGSDILVNILPKFGNRELWGIAYWQYLGFIILLVAAYLLHQLLSRIIRPIVRRLSRSKRTIQLPDPKLVWKISRLASLLVVVIALKLFVPALQLPIEVAEFIMLALKIIRTVFILLLALRILDMILFYADIFAEKTPSKLDEQLLPILKRIVQAIIVIAALFHILRLLDVNVTALIAGISIGGLALALAAQDTVKNLIGSAMIFFDQPFQIDDYIIGSGYEGTVEEVGFRTTRIRNIDQSIISVPNGTLANMVIQNLGLRHMRMLNLSIAVTYDTPPDSLDQFVKGLREIIINHPLASSEIYLIHFNSMGDFSLNIMFRAYLAVPTYAEELEVREGILFAIVRLAERIGVRFAFPTRTLHVEEFPGKLANTPKYEVDEAENRVKEFVEELKKQFDES